MTIYNQVKLIVEEIDFISTKKTTSFEDGNGLKNKNITIHSDIFQTKNIFIILKI